MSVKGWKRASDETLAAYHLIRRPGMEPLERLLVEDDSGKLWLLKTIGLTDPHIAPRARFAYLLGKPFVNVAEVQALDAATAKAICGLGIRDAADQYQMDQCFLVRVAETYRTDELPCKTLDSATAAELVFSLWIRRRDAHAENRGYNVDGIPTFFDFDVAFGTEKKNQDVRMFFTGQGRGQATEWRVQETESEQIVTTEIARTPCRQTGIHMVHSLAVFETEVRAIAQKLLDDSRNLQKIAVAAIPQWSRARSPHLNPRNLVPFLNETRSTLLTDVEVMLESVMARS